MLIFCGILAAASLVGIIYIFLSKKSAKPVKMAALAALILGGLTVGICGIVIYAVPSDTADEYQYIFTPPEEAPAEKSGSTAGLVIFLLILLAFFGFIVYTALKEKKKSLKTNSR